MEIKLTIFTVLFKQSTFTQYLRDGDSDARLQEIKSVVEWFMAAPRDIKGYSDARIVIERDNKQVFQFTMDNYTDKEFAEQEMRRFEKNLMDFGRKIFSHEGACT